VKSYSELEVFSPEELLLWRRAVDLVARIPEPGSGREIRCHELARAMGRVLGLEVQDGHYGFVEHSWLWTRPLPRSALTRETRLGFPNILDVYAVGQMPQVQLVACENPGLPHVGWAYRPGKAREDVDEQMVLRLRAVIEEWCFEWGASES
jgi:hypothetical protein